MFFLRRESRSGLYIPHLAQCEKAVTKGRASEASTEHQKKLQNVKTLDQFKVPSQS